MINFRHEHNEVPHKLLTWVKYMSMFCDRATAPPDGTGMSLKVSLGRPDASQILGCRLWFTLMESAASAMVSLESL